MLRVGADLLVRAGELFRVLTNKSPGFGIKRVGCQFPALLPVGLTV